MARWPAPDEVVVVRLGVVVVLVLRRARWVGVVGVEVVGWVAGLVASAA